MHTPTGFLRIRAKNSLGLISEVSSNERHKLVYIYGAGKGGWVGGCVVGLCGVGQGESGRQLAAGLRAVSDHFLAFYLAFYLVESSRYRHPGSQFHVYAARNRQSPS